MQGLIFNMQRFSIHDGPGIRTTVFFKGCNLNCAWCHNPESQSSQKEILFYEDKCVHCGSCENVPEGDTNFICLNGARELCGKEMTPKEILKEILLDKPYYASEGGVTFSGGEPFAQREVLEETIDLAKENGINCAVETSLVYFDERIFSKLDLVMADLKIWDDGLHKKYTGVSNKVIIENFKKLNSLGVPIIARTPIVPETEQGIPQISAFLKGLENVKQYELLPFHPLGETKRKALGLEKTEFSVPSKEYMKELDKYVFIR